MKLISLAVLLAAFPACVTFGLSPGGGSPATRAEATGYAETSTHTDVVAFLDSLAALGAPVGVGSIGQTTEGREIPYAVASRPRFTTPDAARASGRPIIYVQGNIHGGEVEGKEALQALLRDLLFDPEPNVLDSIVLIAVPIYNADGNESWGPQTRNRSEQHGPESVGQRANVQGLDLNRDYMKAEAPETRGALDMFNRWSPDLLVDLHATNGSYHGYGITYAPPLIPGAAGPAASGGIAPAEYARDELLPELRRRVRDRHGLESYDYGNFATRYGADVNTDSVRDGWFSYDHRPRFGTNYYALRGGVALLVEAYSHDPFERRVRASYDFLSEILSLAAERSAELLAVTRDDASKVGATVAIRSELTTTPFIGDVLAEVLAEDPDSIPDEPGVHPGIRRTGRFRTLRIPVHDRFTPTLEVVAPRAYLIPSHYTETIEILGSHGLEIEPITTPVETDVEVFAIDSVSRAERSFQGHLETRIEGEWSAERRSFADGWYRVAVDQPFGLVAVYLLEPESDDGIVAWCCPADTEPWRRTFLGGALEAGAVYPVLRVR
jgi:hypothetical protein